jgi:hypothetical protein
LREALILQNLVLRNIQVCLGTSNDESFVTISESDIAPNQAKQLAEGRASHNIRQGEFPRGN